MMKTPTENSSASFDLENLQSSDDSSLEGSFCDEDLTSSHAYLSETPERDEKKEVYKMSAQDTKKVQLMRLAMTLALLLTALGITLTTFKLLKEEENKNFSTAVS